MPGRARDIGLLALDGIGQNPGLDMERHGWSVGVGV